ncbi:MAG TPA: 2-dehydropantoate 2-reductase [Acetobacteraceae bacterium]|jgi:2-dehydropantoate 2-reductase|nr:2-dehydropantoate 2-reductase [Acetobacteraceae bacterium]
MADIAVIGPGAIGGTVVVRLGMVSAHVVTVCARSALPQLTLETAEGTMTLVPHVLATADQGSPVDWVLVATKAYGLPSAAGWLRRLVGPETRLAVLQNGVEHVERFVPYVPATRIVPVVVDMPVERIAPGYLRQRGTGRFTVAADANGKAFAGLFLNTGIEVVITPDFRSAAWRKLAVNCAGAVSALVLKPAGIAQRAPVAEVMRALVRECIAVGRAEGAELEDSLVEAVVDGYRNGPADAINSLHADRMAGRPMEIDARNGAIVRLGRTHHIETPVNQIIVALLEATA